MPLAPPAHTAHTSSHSSHPRHLSAGVWESCEARCYEERNDYFPAYAGPSTASGGVLVAFVGYEDDPCQDTAKQDIRYGPHKAASAKKKGQGDGQQKGQADKKEEKKGAGRERKAFVHPLARDGGDDGDSAAASSSSPSSSSRPGGGSGVNGHWGEQKKLEIEARAREKERDGDKRRAIDKDDQQSASQEVFTDVPDECVAYVAVTEKTVRPHGTHACGASMALLDCLVSCLIAWSLA
jgi:hypothetical protein